MGKKKKKSKKEAGVLDDLQDEWFYFIAGYTSGGAPYGITWEEAERDGLLDDEDKKRLQYDEEEDLPF